MKTFDIDIFMRNVRKEARESDVRITHETRSLLEILRLCGEDFIMAAYRKVLLRDADPGGIDAYSPFSSYLTGKIRILIILYSSVEFSMCHAVSSNKKKNLYYYIHLFSTLFSLMYDFVYSLIFRRHRIKKQTMDEFYFAFENKYREDFYTIHERMEIRYAYTLTQARALGGNALDLGCGRGEFVYLFSLYKFSSFGVDSNPYAVSQARKRGLNVRLGDIFSYLRKQPDSSQTVISAIHVIEHMPFDNMRELIREIHRVLQPGGLLILETPNIRNILVSSGDFYRDPTHIQHVFPDTLDFLLNNEGFEGSSYLFSKDEDLISYTKIHLNTLDDYVDISRDIAWIGYKKI